MPLMRMASMARAMACTGVVGRVELISSCA